MNYQDVSEVIELTKWETVNEYLNLGWKLLNTYTRAYDSEPPRVFAQTLVYSLAWTEVTPTKAVHPGKKWNFENDLDG